MKKINAELEDFLDVADGGFSNIQELNDAFEGNTVEKKEEYDIVYDYKEPNGIRLEKRKQPKKKRNAPQTAQVESGPGLEMVLEENKNVALVPVSSEAQKKQRN